MLQVYISVKSSTSYVAPIHLYTLLKKDYMFRNPRASRGEESSTAVEGFLLCSPSPRSQPPPPPLQFILFFCFIEEYTEQGVYSGAQEGPWTFVKRFDCTAHAEHNQQVLYRACKTQIYCLGTTQTQSDAIWQKVPFKRKTHFLQCF